MTGSGEGSVVCESDSYWAMMPNTWRGDVVVYQATVARNGWDLGIVRGAGKPELLISGPGHQVHGQLSPDGRWLAYSSDESGSWDVLVRGMATGSTLQISAGGGSQPRWRFDVAADGQRFVVTTVAPDSPPPIITIIDNLTR